MVKHQKKRGEVGHVGTREGHTLKPVSSLPDTCQFMIRKSLRGRVCHVGRDYFSDFTHIYTCESTIPDGVTSGKKGGGWSCRQGLLLWFIHTTLSSSMSVQWPEFRTNHYVTRIFPLMHLIIGEFQFFLAHLAIGHVSYWHHFVCPSVRRLSSVC